MKTATTTRTIGMQVRSEINAQNKFNATRVSPNMVAKQKADAKAEKEANLPRSVNVPSKIQAEADMAREKAITAEYEADGKVTKPVTKPAPKAPKAKPAYMLFLEALIAEGKYTQKELQDKGVEKFPEVAKSTIQTVIIDSKNIKYNRFEHLAVKNDKGILEFIK